MSSEAPEKDPRLVGPEGLERRSWATSGVAERKAIPTAPRGSAPAGREWTPEQERVIAELYADALAGQIPLNRPLKYWEPAQLNERHLAMIMMRASGVHQRLVAKAFGATDANVSIILNHPAAQHILARLMAVKATHESDIEQRLNELCSPAMDSLEEFFTADDPEVMKVAGRRAPMAFKVLEAAGKTAARKVQSEVNTTTTLRIDADVKQLSEIRRALHEVRLLRDPQYAKAAPGEVMQALSTQGGVYDADFEPEEGGGAAAGEDGAGGSEGSEAAQGEDPSRGGA